MRSTEDRPRARSDLVRLVLLACCLGLLFLVLWVSAPVLGSVSLGHIGWWVAHTSPTSALTAVGRLVGLVVTGWLIGTSVLYAVAGWSGSHRLRRAAARLTLGPLRRILDGATAASIMVSALTVAASSASASPGAVTPAAAPAAPPLGTAETAAAPEALTPGLGYADLPVGTKVYVVQPGDCLSVIAEQHLGDWRRDVEIDRLNRGRIQSDGRALVDDHWIYPGWILVMPPDAVGTAIVGRSATAGSGDRGTDGVPVPAPPAVVPSITAVPAASVQSSPPAPSQLPTPPGAGPTVGRPDRAAGSSTGAAPAQGIGHAAIQPPADRSRMAELGVAALAAAGFVWGLTRRRRELMHSRRSGSAVRRNPPRVERADARARATAEAGMATRVDLGLRYLGSALAGLTSGGGPVPSIAMVRADAEGMEVLVDPPTPQAVSHFEALDGGSVWVLDPELGLSQLESLAAEAWSFLPGLVSVGTCGEATVLVNLEHAGSLALEGDAERVDGLMAQMRLELRTQPWALEMLEGVEVFGLRPPSGAEPAGGPPTDVPTDVLAALVRRARRCQTELATVGSAPLQRAVTCQWLPQVVLAGKGVAAAALSELLAAAVPERSALAVVTSSPFAGEARWRLLVSETGAARLRGRLGDRAFEIGLQVDSDAAAIDLLESALTFPLGPLQDATRRSASSANAGRPPDNQGPAALPELVDDRPQDFEERPVEDSHIDHIDLDDEVDIDYEMILTGAQLDLADDEVLEEVDPELADLRVTRNLELPVDAVEVTVLGAVGLRGAGAPDAVPANRRGAALAVLAYLALKGRPVTADELAAALWPADDSKDNFGEPRRKTVMNVISRARVLLGTTGDGASRLLLGEGGYALHPSVKCDWDRFEALSGPPVAGREDQAIDRLRAALELVAGPPFLGSLANPFYEWVSAQHVDLVIGAQVVDAAEALGRLAVGAGDHSLAEWAVRKGLELEPAREELYQVWMHSVGRAGRVDQVEEIYRRACRALQRHIDPGLTPKEETQAVRAAYVRPAALRV